uniref:C2H2-type domain-containing protein n=1 Tax=Poecilia mexicana TaxID=48701 RepID=A0A3B3Z3E7_9TELE
MQPNDTPTSSSAAKVKTEPDGEISGGPEPNREPDPSTYLQPNTEESYSASFETEVSDDSEDDNLSGSGSENEDSDEDWREPRTRQSGVNSKVGSKAAEKTFNCTDHFKQFVRKQMFQKHMAGHSGEKSSSCSVEKNHSRGKQNGDTKMGLEPGRKSFSCDDCGKTFQKLGALKCHVRIYRCEKSTVCEDCGKIFHSRCHLKTHHRPHTGERPFVCDKCGKRFTRKPGLQVHMTCHTGEKPFQCEECGRRFVQKRYLKSHMLMHTGEKPFSCDLCFKLFTRAENLRNHKLRIHSKQRFHTENSFGKTFCTNFRELKADLLEINSAPSEELLVKLLVLYLSKQRFFPSPGRLLRTQAGKYVFQKFLAQELNLSFFGFIIYATYIYIIIIIYTTYIYYNYNI